MIGVGVIGAGVMGTAHVATLAALGGVRVAAVADLDPARAAASARQVPGARVATAEALIADPEVQAVLIVSPDASHAHQVLACLEAGKPVLCEKPLAVTRGEGERILAADRGRDLVQVGYMRRFDPAYRDLKARLDTGVIGQPMLARMIHRNAIAPAFMEGLQGITNSLVHEFDILRYLTGDEITRLRVSVPGAAPGGRLLDPVLVTAETAGGLLVELENAANVRYGYEVRAEFLGHEGALRLAQPQATGQFLAGAGGKAGGGRMGWPADFVERFRDAYRLQFQDWIAALNRGETRGSGATARDGLAALLVAEAGVRAWEARDWAEVHPLPGL